MIHGVRTRLYDAGTEKRRKVLRDAVGLFLSDDQDVGAIFRSSNSSLPCRPAGPTGRPGTPGGFRKLSFPPDGRRGS